MTGPSLRAALADLNLGAYQFAAIVRCQPATVYKWLKPGATVPGYVETIVELLREARDLRAAPTFEQAAQ
jgi:hypothetical protein